MCSNVADRQDTDPSSSPLNLYGQITNITPDSYIKVPGDPSEASSEVILQFKMPRRKKRRRTSRPEDADTKEMAKKFCSKYIYGDR